MDNKIKELRSQRGWSQEALSEKLKVSRQTIVSLESRRYYASLVLAHKIAQLFEMRIEDIFIFEGDENL
ncbi:helix-turn-helix transcriptional regulator [Alicyclobacillus tolerans]|uniref:helix-turn-helix transcriptional regulator n=1 Tax=Alicyclobacillus tolerans TaxID=90970 RepID=UPI003B766CAD